MRIKRWEMVELVVPAGTTGSKINYPDIPQLRDDTTQDIIVKGLESFSIESMPLSPMGNVVATTAQLQNAFLVLYIEDEESVLYLPLIKLNAMFASLGTGTMQQQFEPTELENVKIDWNKTYIQFATPPANEDQFSIMLGVSYKKLPAGAWAALTKSAVPGM